MLDYKRIGLYGGTFNPPHIGHIQAAKSAAEQLRLDLLLLTPSALPPHKELPDQSPDGEARMEMLRMASKGLCCAEADDTELRRGGKSYTVHTLEQLQERYPGAEFWLLVGTDMFLTLQDWYQSERILSMVRVAVFPRASQPRLPAIERQRQYLTAAYGARVDVVVNTAVDISSSHLRELLAQGLGREYLHPDVYNYIACWGLYGMRAGREPVRDLDEYQHDRHLRKDPDGTCQHYRGIRSKQRDRHGHRQFEKIGSSYQRSGRSNGMGQFHPPANRIGKACGNHILQDQGDGDQYNIKRIFQNGPALKRENDNQG